MKRIAFRDSASWFKVKVGASAPPISSDHIIADDMKMTRVPIRYHRTILYIMKLISFLRTLLRNVFWRGGYLPALLFHH